MYEELNTNVFLSKRTFYDDANFPYGFHRSGDFTIAEADLLAISGYMMKKLHRGEIPPTTSEHKRFLHVINGTVAAKYSAENTYLKYLQLIETKNHFIPAITKVKSKVPIAEESNERNY